MKSCELPSLFQLAPHASEDPMSDPIRHASFPATYSPLVQPVQPPPTAPQPPSVVIAPLSGDLAAMFDLDFSRPSLQIVSWVDPANDVSGHDPRSPYVERFWLSMLGPSSTWLVRALAYGFEASPTGFELPTLDTARALGLGNRLGRNSPFSKAMARLCQFDLAALLPDEAVAVRPKLPWLSRRMISGLPASLRREHTEWEIAYGGLPSRGPFIPSAPISSAARRPSTAAPHTSNPSRQSQLSHTTAETVAAQRQRAAQLALSLAQAGEDVDGIERALARWKFHPSLCRHFAEWAAAQILTELRSPEPVR
jgi:hypothetical protein